MDAPHPSSSIPPAHESNNAYTILVRGEQFQLSRNQIDFDSPNFFSTCFSSGFTESAKRTVTLDRNPALFALIVEYLSGYPILPLSAQAAPPLMSLAMARRCLLADAQFYGLQKLAALLATSTLNLDTRWMGYDTQAVDVRDLVKHTLPAGIIQQPDGSVVSPQTGLSVVAFAHNVVATFICTRLVHGEKSEEADKSSRALMLEIAFPSGNSPDIYLSLPVPILDVPSAMAYSEQHRMRVAQRHSYWGLAGDSIVREFGTLNINGNKDSLSSIYSHPYEVYSSTARHYDLGTRIWRSDWPSQQRRELEHRSFRFWADELLFRVIPRAQSNSPMEADAWVEIVKADLRTRQHFLENLHVEPLGQGGLYA